MHFSAAEHLTLPCRFATFTPGELHQDGRRYLPTVGLSLAEHHPNAYQLPVVDRHHRVNAQHVGSVGMPSWYSYSASSASNQANLTKDFVCKPMVFLVRHVYMVESLTSPFGKFPLPRSRTNLSTVNLSLISALVA